MKKLPLGKIPKLEPKGTCLAGSFYEHYHGKDGMKWDNEKQEFPACPYCIIYMPCKN